MIWMYLLTGVIGYAVVALMAAFRSDRFELTKALKGVGTVLIGLIAWPYYVGVTIVWLITAPKGEAKDLVNESMNEVAEVFR